MTMTRKPRGRKLIHVGGRRIRGKAVAAASYLALALGWGWATDHLIYFYAPDPIRAARLQTAEGFLFYVVTTALIYFLVSWYAKKVAAIRLELEADRRLRSLGEVAARSLTSSTTCSRAVNCRPTSLFGRWNQAATRPRP